MTTQYENMRQSCREIYTKMRGLAVNRARIVSAAILLNVVFFVYVFFDGKTSGLFANTTMTEIVFDKDSSMEYSMECSVGCIRIDSLDPDLVPRNRSIFFIETNKSGLVKLTPRQTCSIESAARINPDRLVYVLFLSPKFDCGYDITASQSLLANYQNIRYRYIDFFKYVDDTPIKYFVQSGIMEKGYWPIEQRSDLLRWITLWKFGGIYMDLDVVSLKQLPLIDFIGAQYPEELLASCIIGIQNKNIADEAIYMFEDGWNGEVWNKNGPELLTNLMSERCGTNSVKSMYMDNIDCKNVTIFPPEAFCSIGWYEWETFFDPTKNDYVREKLNKSMAVHFWNKFSKNKSIVLNSGQPYANIASESCPKTFNTVIERF